MNDLTAASMQIRSNLAARSAVPKATAVVSNSPAQAAPSGVFVSSPKGSIDAASGIYVIKFRDSRSGEVTMQYPAEKVVHEYRKSADVVVKQAPKVREEAPRTESPKAETTSESVEA